MHEDEGPTTKPFPMSSSTNLLLAAPDMYAALAGLLDLWPLSGYELEAYCDATLIPAAQAAIAKARGGAW